jgi:putative hemolysin
MMFDLDQRIHFPLPGVLRNAMRPLLSKALGLDQLEQTYHRARADHATRADSGTLFAWMDCILKSMNIGYRVDGQADGGGNIPREGPLVIVANHPFGLMDPVVLAHYISQQRGDLRIMANSLITSLPELHAHVLAVKPFDSHNASDEKNDGATKAALQHLKTGGALLVFPAGEVTHYQPGHGLLEGTWSPHIASLIRESKATVLPIHVSGRNSALFHASGMIHKAFRTGMLVREFLRKKESFVQVHLGAAISHSALAKEQSDAEVITFLRLRTLMLSRRHLVGGHRSAPTALTAPVSPGPQTSDLRQEISALSASGACLASQGELSVYVAKAGQIPLLLQEIGRQREITFRAVGEGTGMDIDLDQFDNHYLHLFIWDHDGESVAGAYRLGCVDSILRDHGASGLYTSTLFRFKRGFLPAIQDAVELGRSFIAQNYQRNAVAMPLLWKGIVQWLGREKRYRKLFGPVSISDEYSAASRRLMVRYLRKRHGHATLMSLVKPRIPFAGLGINATERELIGSQWVDADECSALVATIEQDGKGFPVLLKHYLRLNGKILCFNRDPSFGNVVDGLMMVDMLDTDPRLPSRLMGKAAWTAYLQHHQEALPV